MTIETRDQEDQSKKPSLPPAADTAAVSAAPAQPEVPPPSAAPPETAAPPPDVAAMSAAGSAAGETSPPSAAVQPEAAAAAESRSATEAKAAEARKEAPPAVAPARRLPPKQTATGGKSSSALLYLIGVPLLLAIGALGAWIFIQDRLVAVEQARDDMVQQVASIAERVQALEAQVASLPSLEARIAPLAERMDRIVTDIGDLKTVTQPTVQLAAQAADIEQRINRLDQQLQVMAATHLKASDVVERVQRLETNAVVAATLDQRVSALEAIDLAKREALARASSVVLAVGHLAKAVKGSTGFSTELATLKGLTANDAQMAAAIQALEPMAATGVPTLAQLRAEFPAVALAVTRTEMGARGEEWSDRVLHRLSTLVTVRRVGPDAVATGGTHGLLAAADSALAAGELAAAAAAVEAIQGPGAEAAAAWLAAARARLTADEALTQLEDRAITYLSQLKG
jgi:hypothetical protein